VPVREADRALYKKMRSAGISREAALAEIGRTAA
jgi:hypothetical protein